MKLFDEKGDFEYPEQGRVLETLEKGVIVVGLTALAVNEVVGQVHKKVSSSLAELLAIVTGEKPNF